MISQCRGTVYPFCQKKRLLVGTRVLGGSPWNSRGWQLITYRPVFTSPGQYFVRTKSPGNPFQKLALSHLISSGYTDTRLLDGYPGTRSTSRKCSRVPGFCFPTIGEDTWQRKTSMYVEHSDSSITGSEDKQQYGIHRLS